MKTKFSELTGPSYIIKYLFNHSSSNRPIHAASSNQSLNPPPAFSIHPRVSSEDRQCKIANLYFLNYFIHLLTLYMQQRQRQRQLLCSKELKVGAMERRIVANKTWEESRKTWHIAGPAILTAIFQFSIGFVTVAFVGHLGEVELAAVSIAQSVVEGFSFGVMLGMGSALETLCGQAVGAGQFHLLGIYMQRSWIICGITALILTPLYIFTSQILQLLHQTKPISKHAGKYCIWVIPQLFAYAANFPMQKFLQSQSKVWVMTIIAGVVLPIHVLLNWIFVTKLGQGLAGAAISGNISWWLINFTLMVYILSGCFPEAWTGFSMSAFKSLTSFVRLSLASAIMLCLELWYYTAVIILVGYLNNPEVAISAISICMNFQLWVLMIALGFNAAVSVRVSNELGAGHPQAARFSVIISVSTSLLFGLLFMAIVLGGRTYLPRLFTDEPDVLKETSKLGYLLGATILINSIQPVLSGVAIGAGWQSLVAFINIGCYYLIGLPVGAILGFKFKLNEMGIWLGMLGGSLLQTIILLAITFRTKWQKQALQAEERIRTWGGTNS